MQTAQPSFTPSARISMRFSILHAQLDDLVGLSLLGTETGWRLAAGDHGATRLQVALLTRSAARLADDLAAYLTRAGEVVRTSTATRFSLDDVAGDPRALVAAVVDRAERVWATTEARRDRISTGDPTGAELLGETADDLRAQIWMLCGGRESHAA